MILFHTRLGKSPAARSIRSSFALAAVIGIAYASTASAQLTPNQTHGFGNGRLITFSYLQNFRLC